VPTIMQTESQKTNSTHDKNEIIKTTVKRPVARLTKGVWLPGPLRSPPFVQPGGLEVLQVGSQAKPQS